jgi:hypothetical protein
LTEVAVIGAGSSGLAVLKALRRHGIAAECFERGCEVGGLWRYDNENGLSGVDHIIYATGYRISLPFLTSSLLPADGRDFPLYRQIVPPAPTGLYFAGFVDAPGGLLPLVEAQGEWIAAAVGGRLRLPPDGQMRRALGQGERRTRERFPNEGPHSIRCDPHAYRRLLQSDLRRMRRSSSGAQRRARTARTGG